MKTHHFVSPVLLTLMSLGLSFGLIAESQDAAAKTTAVFTASAVNYGNKATDDFISWLKLTKCDHHIISLKLDDDKSIVEITWNVCAYANSDILERLAKLPKLRSFEVVSNKTSLTTLELINFQKNYSKLKVASQVLSTEVTRIKIEQVAAPDR